MKAKVYIRIASHPDGRDADYKVAASIKPNYSPLTAGSGFSERDLPTVAFALDFEIPDSVMHQAEQTVARIELPEEDLRVAASVSYMEDEDDE